MTLPHAIVCGWLARAPRLASRRLGAVEGFLPSSGGGRVFTRTRRCYLTMLQGGARQFGTTAAKPQKPVKKDQALPVPPEKGEATQVEVGGVGVKLDVLGPLVVNRDGSTGRVANWAEMTEDERATTLKLLSKRNRQRLEALKAEGGGGSGSGSSGGQ